VIGHDVRYAWRSWRRQPGTAALAIGTLAIGIGLNTAIFSSVESVLLRPLAFRDPERLVTLVQTPGGAVHGGIGAWTARQLASRSRTLQSVSAYDDAQATLMADGQAEILRGMRTSVEFFDTLGTSMALGRGFAAGEDRSARANLVVLTHTLWADRFGADPGIIGRVLQLNGVPHHVIGVLPASFRPLRMTNPAETPTYYMPLIDRGTAPACRACVGTRAIGRVRTTASLPEAQAELGALMRALVNEYPHDYAASVSVAVVPLRAALVGGVRTALWAVLGAVGLVLLLACVNLACLQLARTTDRHREFAVRSALGATRRQIARALLIESGMLALAGGTAGCVVAWTVTRDAAAFAPRELPRFDEVTVDSTVLLFSIAISAVTAIAIGLLPAWGSAHADVNDALKRASDRTTPARRGVRTALIGAEIAVAFALAVATGLLARTVVGLERVDAGFDARNVLTLTPTGPADSRADRLQYFQRLIEAVAAVPGVTQVGMTSNVPLSHTEPVTFQIDTDLAMADADLQSADMFIVAGDYFQALRIPLRRGRLLTRRDGVEDPAAALVSASFAAKYFPAIDPIGRRIRIGGDRDHGAWLTIVGIVGDVHSVGLDRDADLAIYQSQATNVFHYTRLVARTSGNPAQFEGAVRAAIRSLDPLQPIFHLQPMDDYVAASMAERRFALTLIGILGSLALLLAVIGVYGVTSYAVAQRTAEMGIRAALGATRTDLLRMVLQESVSSVAVGIGAGLILSVAAVRGIATLLFGVRATDPVTLFGAAILLAGAALAGCYVPARRASRIDPLSALRFDE
jgi:putative ABC transport system permease protein